MVISPDPQYEEKGKLEALVVGYLSGELRDTFLLFEDEVDIKLNPTLSRCWTRRGRRVRVVTPRKNRKNYAFGAIESMAGGAFWTIASRKDSVSFLRFIQEIMVALPHKRVILVLDNFIVHKSTMTTRKLSLYEEEGKLECFFLPSYVPKLNPIERLWQLMRRRVTHNHRFPTMEVVEEAVNYFFTQLSTKLEALRNIFGINQLRKPAHVS